MGSGKTFHAIKKLKQTNENYIYITPYLSEIERLLEKEGLYNLGYREPLHLGDGKLDNLHELLAQENGIITTHALFRMSNQETADLIKDGKYNIIIDESMDVFDIFEITNKDYEMLIDHDTIILEDDLVVWNDDEYIGKFNFLKRICENGDVYFVGKELNNVLFSWTFDINVMMSFKSITIMTYLFEAQLMYYYFLLNGIDEFDKYYVEKNELKEFTSYQYPNIEHLIDIYDGDMNDIGDRHNALSVNWFNNNKALSTKLQKHIYNYIRNIVNTKSKDIIWTTFKSQYSKLKGKGYTTSFVSLNARATNEYADRNTVVYCANRYISPNYTIFLKKHDIEFNQELFALSELVQFIWRSQIRNKEPINIYIPSSRMRKLLQDWVMGQITSNYSSS